MNFQKGRYGIYIAREIGHFAYDLGIRRNHFCWIRDVKLSLGFKFQKYPLSLTNPNPDPTTIVPSVIPPFRTQRDMFRSPIRLFQSVFLQIKI